MKKTTYIFLSLFFSAAMLYGQSINWSKNIIAGTTISGAKKNFVINLDNDSDNNLDIIITANPEAGAGEDPLLVNVAWLRNLGGENFQQLNIDFRMVQARGLAAGDLTGDGFADIVVGSRTIDSSLVWYENDGSPENGGWIKHYLGEQAPFNYIVHAVDFDDDGDLDILDGVGDDVLIPIGGDGSAPDSIRWFENDGSGNFTQHNLIGYPTPSGIAYGDFDADDDLDIAAAAYTHPSASVIPTSDDVRWWSQGSGSSFSQQQILQETYGANDLVSEDLDKNGTLDLIGAGYKVNTLDWWSNNGSGVFSSINVIDTDFEHTRNVAVKDIDGDGDLDLASAADVDNTINWYENDGNENFTAHQINDEFTYAYFVTTVDLDGDGDIDLVGTAQDASELSWWESDLAEERNITAGDPDTVNFYNGKVAIDFATGFSGGNTSVFFNQGENQNRTALSGIDHVAQKGFYTIKTTSVVYNASVSFSYAGISEWSAIDNENALRICYYDPSTNQWKVAGTSQTIYAGGDSIVVAGLSSSNGEFSKYSTYTIGSLTSDNSLPVELVVFKAMAGKNGVALEWETASEINNLGFELWRRSLSDTTFRPIASYREFESLRGLGTRSFGQEYAFVDDEVQNGERYTYRLYDVDYDGKRYRHRDLKVDNVDNSLVKVINGQVPDGFTLNQNYPNPFNGRTLIEFSVPEALAGQTASINVFDESGRKVKELYNRDLVTGNYLISWDGTSDSGSPAASGMYIYRLVIGKYSVAKRMTLIK